MALPYPHLRAVRYGPWRGGTRENEGSAPFWAGDAVVLVVAGAAREGRGQPQGGRHVAHGCLGWQEREDFPGSHKVPAELAPRGRHARRWPVIRREGRRLRFQALVRSVWLPRARPAMHHASERELLQMYDAFLEFYAWFYARASTPMTLF
eukprot:COSAG05_NODE_278_length_12330_cov_14.132205_4_plen_151_part_00